MAQSCVHCPDRGTKLFKRLRTELGRNTAWSVWGLALSDRFQEKYGKELEYDAEGIPTYESMMANEYVRKFIDEKVRKEDLQRAFRERPSSRESRKLALAEAMNYNSKGSDKFVAVVNDDGVTVKAEIVDRNEMNEMKAREQAGMASMHQSLVNLLAPIGITEDILLQVEESENMGLEDMQGMARDAITMIKLANGMKTNEIVGKPLVKATILAMKDNANMARSLDHLERSDEARNAYRDEEENSITALEAMTRLAQENVDKEGEDPNLARTPVMQRAMEDIRKKYRNLSIGEFSRAMTDTDAALQAIAANIGSKTSESKGNKQRKDRERRTKAAFKDLNGRIKACRSFIARTMDLEGKRRRVAIRGEKGRLERMNAIVDELEKIMDVDLDIPEEFQEERLLGLVKGLLDYSQYVSDELQRAAKKLDDLDGIKDVQQRFSLLRDVNIQLMSFGEFIMDLKNLRNREEKSKEGSILGETIMVETQDGTREMRLSDITDNLDELARDISSRYLQIALPAFAEYLRPFYGDKVLDLISKRAGRDVSVEELLTSSKRDISVLEYWLGAMADSESIVLQGMDEMVKQKKDGARMKTLEAFREAYRLRKDAEEKGITTFGWMFERDSKGRKTGNYISAVNRGQFYRDYEDFRKRLNKTYGDRPEGEAAKLKEAEVSKWVLEHAYVDKYGNLWPRAEKYRNPEYFKLTDDQKEIFERYLEMKELADDCYPKSRVGTFKAIQMRRNANQRLLDSLGSITDPVMIYKAVMDGLGSEFTEQVDDDLNFGAGGTVRFGKRELMNLPVLYTTRLKNPDELSDDVFHALMAYIAAANNFEAMTDIIDPLEVGVNLIADNMNVKKGYDVLSLLDMTNDLVKAGFDFVKGEKSASRLVKRLLNYRARNVYGQTLKRQEPLKIPRTDKEILPQFASKIPIINLSYNKLASWALSVGAAAQMGFNFVAQTANVITGRAMQNIEAVAGEWFTVKDLFKADLAYAKEMLPLLFNSFGRIRNTKVELFNQLFNVGRSFSKETSRSQRKGILRRLFSRDLLFAGMAAGDHWLHSTTAIAMAMHTKVCLPDGTITNLWNATQIRDVVEGDDRIKEAYIPEGTLLIDNQGNRTKFDVHKWSQKAAKVNREINGNYDTDNGNVAGRTIKGRCLTQYRQWMPPQYEKRFQRRHVNVATEQEMEGNNITILRLGYELGRLRRRLPTLWSDMTDKEKYNVKRTVVELCQFGLTCLLTSLFAKRKKKDTYWDEQELKYVTKIEGERKMWAEKALAYGLLRERNEQAFLILSKGMANQFASTLQNPAPVIGAGVSMYKAVKSTMTPEDFTTYVDRGRYKGKTRWEYNMYHSPIPPYVWMYQLGRVTEGLETGALYERNIYEHGAKMALAALKPKKKKKQVSKEDLEWGNWEEWLKHQGEGQQKDWMDQIYDWAQDMVEGLDEDASWMDHWLDNQGGQRWK